MAEPRTRDLDTMVSLIHAHAEGYVAEFDRRMADCDSACAQMLREEAVSGRVLAMPLPPPAPRPRRPPLTLDRADVRHEVFPLPRK